ncbi:GSCOCG00006925001-RA-CDS, partial [Cotesia congregata]
PPPILAITVETAARAEYFHFQPHQSTNSPRIAFTGDPSGRGSRP